MLPRWRITNRQRFLTFYCLWPFILTLQPGLILSKTSDESLLAPRCSPTYTHTTDPVAKIESSPIFEISSIINEICIIITKSYKIKWPKLTKPVCLTDWMWAFKKISGEGSWNYMRDYNKLGVLRTSLIMPELLQTGDYLIFTTR